MFYYSYLVSTVVKYLFKSTKWAIKLVKFLIYCKMESNFDGYEGLCEIFELTCRNLYFGDKYSKVCFSTCIWSQ